ncbi:MAG TPA: glycosyltransferase [Bacteroidales bacterium]|nr:glycosyltransferase [Bacteroidales bacterium]
MTEKLKTNNSNTFEIPLGSSVQIPDYNHPQPFKQNEIITAAILGFINERQISIELINRIIESKKLQLVLIGSVEPSFKNKLSNIQRVKMTGELKGSALWAELTKIDVGLALYNLKQINPGNTSNKLWQYLLAGKPVVISDLPNLRDMDFPEKSVYRFSDDNKLLDTILLAVNEDSEKSYFERKDFAKQNSWDVRVNQFLGIFRNYFPF